MICPYPMYRWDNPGQCRGCNGDLPRNQDGSISLVYKWCGDECKNLYTIHHHWTWARSRAVNRVGVFKKGWPGYRYLCAHCGELTEEPEVNHIGPRYGDGYGTGCWNHQENLEVLCQRCHVIVTKLQRKARNQDGQIGMQLE